MKPNIPFILGPTASGKTAAALALAQHHSIEIISVDSALVYTDMNIGTAKPSATELAAVPHHLIGIIPPTQVYSAAQFATDATQLINDIIQRDNTPVLVGGTMLYIKALLEPLTNLPIANQETRAQIDNEAAALGWQAMHQKLAEIDPATAHRLSPNDAQRISRALEIYYLSGKPMSQWISDDSTQHELPFTPHLFALIPEPREVLHERINHRFIQMCQMGFLKEVQQLRERGDLDFETPAMRCVGYRQAWAHLDGEYDYEEFIAKGQAATRQLAKRQLTWLRGMKNITLLDPLSVNVANILSQQLDDFKIRRKQ